jgi:hypothetical protein
MTYRLAPVALLVATVAIAGLTGACAFRPVQGTGPIKSEIRTASPFTKLDVSFGIQVDLTVGQQPAITVEAPADLLPIISTEISGDKLRIKGTTEFITRTPVKVHLATPDLEGLELFGGSIVHVDGLAADTLAVAVSGGAQLTATGTAAVVGIEGSGGAQLWLDKLAASLVTLELSGGAQARINASDSVVGDVSGGAHATVYGPASLKVDTGFSGSVDRG